MRIGDVKLLVLPAKNELYAFDEKAEVETQYMVRVDSEVCQRPFTDDEVLVIDIGEGSKYNGTSQWVKVDWLAELTEEDEHE